MTYRDLPYHGPYKELEKARRAAEMLVGFPYTSWSVVELFGEKWYTRRSDPPGEELGTLFVVPSDHVVEFTDRIGNVDTYQYVDSYGFDSDPVAEVVDAAYNAHWQERPDINDVRDYLARWICDNEERYKAFMTDHGKEVTE